MNIGQNGFTHSKICQVHWWSVNPNGARWEDYGEDYPIASQDFILAETAKPFKTAN
jgi:hypothetical protein